MAEKTKRNLIEQCRLKESIFASKKEVIDHQKSISDLKVASVEDRFEKARKELCDKEKQFEDLQKKLAERTKIYEEIQDDTQQKEMLTKDVTRRIEEKERRVLDLKRIISELRKFKTQRLLDLERLNERKEAIVWRRENGYPNYEKEILDRYLALKGNIRVFVRVRPILSSDFRAYGGSRDSFDKLEQAIEMPNQ